MLADPIELLKAKINEKTQKLITETDKIDKEIFQLKDFKTLVDEYNSQLRKSDVSLKPTILTNTDSAITK